MKILTLVLVFFVVALCQVQAGNLFREVSVSKDSWEVIFHKQGIRYLMKIDATERGTSGYLQRLRLLRDESLRLSEKHSHIDIRPIERNGVAGIKIKRTFRDRVTGEEKVETSFEPNHKSKETKK